ncbi:RDD family protein [Paenibacillus sp. GCM10023252]|uniref:RDD family protein n=1 Tax=Paenibacillus sp. GCM10023252 TaxID=3252649 RepID=UPI0036086B26
MTSSNSAAEKVVYVDTKQAALTTNTLPVEHAHPVKTWHRYWARMLDILFFTMVIQIIAALIPAYQPGLWMGLLENVIILILYIPVEALLMSGIGTTCGKWLFNIVVRRTGDDGKLTYVEALMRGYTVIWRGLGLSIPFINLLCLLNAQYDLRAKGTTSWDQDRFLVMHERMGWLRKMASVLLVIGYVCLWFGDFYIRISHI